MLVVKPATTETPLVLTTERVLDLVKSFVLLVTDLFLSVTLTVTGLLLGKPENVIESPLALRVNIPLFSSTGEPLFSVIVYLSASNAS